MGYLRALTRGIVALLLAAFFGFVGWYKTFATPAELAAHSAYTVHLPVLAGKAIGWLEMAGALALVAGVLAGRARRLQALAALALAVEQLFSSWIHWRFGEMGMIGQNTLLIVLLLGLALSGGGFSRGDAEREA